MSDGLPRACRSALEDLWSAWPRPDDAPPAALRHAEACCGCRAELAAFRQACDDASAGTGKPLPWSGLFAEGRLRRLAARTLGALDPAPRPPSLLWNPAFAAAVLAAAALVFRLFLTHPPGPEALQAPALSAEAGTPGSRAEK